MKFTDERLFQNYKQLADFYQKVVQLYALSHERLENYTLYKCLQRLGLRPFAGRLILRDIPKHLDTLSRDGFLVKRSSDEYSINTSIENKVVKELFKKDNFSTFAETLQSFMPIHYFASWNEVSPERYFRSMRIALLEGDFQKLSQLDFSASRRFENYDFSDVYSIIIHPFDREWLQSLPNDTLAMGLSGVMSDLFNSFDINNDIFDFLATEKSSVEDSEGRNFRLLLKWRHVLRGEWEALDKLQSMETDKNSFYYSFDSLYAFVTGNYEQAVAEIDRTVKAFRKEIRKRTISPPYSSLQFGYLALVKLQKPNYANTIINYIEQSPSYLPLHDALMAVAAAQNNQMNIVRELLAQEEKGMEQLFLDYARYWIHGDKADINLPALEKMYQKLHKNKLFYLEALAADLLAHVYKKNDYKTKYYEEIVKTLKDQFPFHSIIHLVPKIEPWERAMNALMTLSNQFEGGDIGTEADKRLIWLINFKTESVQAKEQKVGKNGKWTKGRMVSLERFSSLTNEGDWLTDQDLRVIQSIQQEGYHNYSDFDFNDALIRALAGHPHLYLNNKQRTAVEIVIEQPQLLVKKVGEKYELKFDVKIEEVGLQLVKETPTRYKAIEVTDQHLLIANAIGDEKVLLPQEAVDQIAQIVKGFSKVVNVQSEFLADDVDVKLVESDPTTHIHLLPVGDGFQLEMYVMPFGSHPPYYKPADGGQVIVTDVEGERFQTERDLDKEKAMARAVIKACPSLGNKRKLDTIWEFDNAEACLEILSELQPLKLEEKVVLEWPKGERLKLKSTVSFDQLSMQIKGSNDWFEASGTLKVGEDLVMNMRELMALLNKSESRFVQLKDGQFLALTNRFRNQLKALEAYSDETKEGNLRFHPLAAFAVEELTSDAKELDTDSAWRKQLKKLKDAEKKKVKVPSTFKATLRSYQQEGFDWLMKLANWDVGACLADDMGLGKTVQALAAILARAKDGPTLVVCPASVRINWEREAFKFAPTLHPIQFGDGDRQQILNDLKPFDMLITSYGLMQTEEEAFSKIQFSTIVLDEAQAIKNRAAKRSKAAMELNGDFKIITTGTPIENHLGELWNLFRFINPGLLGSMDHFRDRFALPIEKYGDEARRDQLKKLIRPFVLRRRKTEVLKELPEKTEIVLTVELSPQEKAFYEALRRSAMEKLKELKPGDGSSHLQILAEITRLRQACCNPKLVMKNSAIKSSKLELFNKTISELIENDHKVLVFSQFVQHLKILEANLKRQKISYQYLDGSTSQKKRQKAIDAFQGGEGDVFLISLKAGGVGLNLTAADYVIHMDPWWNPAVEDQASDRAHRIGQKRPVTIYRLVTQGTIEEKIVMLHDQKRDLADSLLSGTNSGNRLSADDLMALIKEGMQGT